VVFSKYLAGKPSAAKYERVKEGNTSEIFQKLKPLHVGMKNT